MDLIQRKLTKSEWEGIEVPVSQEEKEILKLIKDGYMDVNIRYNNNQSLLNYMRIENSELMNEYLYKEYFKSIIDKICKTFHVDFKIKLKNSKQLKPKKADIFRITNINQNNKFPFIGNTNVKIFEYVLIEIIENLLSYKEKKSTKWVFYYYTLKNLNLLAITNINSIVKEFVNYILKIKSKDINLKYIIERSSEMIEKNEFLTKYSDITLYDHQKKLFSLFKVYDEEIIIPKLILYIAPTATGKTLSPIGLAEKYRIIFVCAARHVGLALAKSAISSGRKIALAFNCKDAEDVRLHYSAAKEVIRDRRSGSIRKVDNTVGDNVEIIICDIKSYLPAMYYMLAFNEKEKIITYWDEPTITMDYQTHSFHEIIKDNWSKNLIPNIVLSSATLPKENELPNVISDYIGKFGGQVESIISHDCKKSIPIINRQGEIYLPHFQCTTYEDLKKMISHCENYPTIMRYLDLNEIIKFILYIHENNLISERYNLSNYFTKIEEINLLSLKKYYFILLKNLPKERWSTIYEYYQEKDNRLKPFASNIHIVTSDSYTLTDGPTIYLADDVAKIAKFCLQEAKIPDKVMKDIMNDIEFNNILNKEISKLEKDYEDGVAKDEGKEKKMENLRISPELRRLKLKIDDMRQNIKSTSLHDLFIPNRLAHLNKYKPNDIIVNNPFTCDIDDSTVVKLMQLDDIDDTWKVLLLMGIGVFTNHESISYTEIMKELAEQQKLYMIIASSDFIYGTNYQMCHGFIGKDLNSMTQEKAIQAMGRVGRNKIQQNYSIRFRDDSLIQKLFLHEENKPEIINMNKLFNSN